MCRMKGRCDVVMYSQVVCSNSLLHFFFVMGMVYRWGKEERMCDEFDEVLRELVGLLCCNDFREGSRKAAAELMQDNETFFQEIFEVGRR